MNAKLVRHTREGLLTRRSEIVELMDPDERAVRARAEQGLLVPGERDLLLELEGVDFLLGDRA